jgi:hypothetical protein
MTQFGEKSKSNNFHILLEKGETSVILIVFKSVLYLVHAYTSTISYPFLHISQMQ